MPYTAYSLARLACCEPVQEGIVGNEAVAIDMQWRLDETPATPPAGHVAIVHVYADAPI